MLVSILTFLYVGIRVAAAGGFLLALVVGGTHWGVRRGTIPPFGGWARLVRRLGDPVLRPLETRLVRAGGNPQDAPGWLIGGAVVLALVLIAAGDWVIGFVYLMAAQLQSGGTGALVLIVGTLFTILNFALLARVIGSWIGLGRYHRWMRLAYVLTDWLLVPIQRLLPATGMVDFSPMVAYFLLYFLRGAILSRL